MYNSDTLTNILYGLIGWRQNYDVEDFTVAPSLTESSTSEYYQDFSSLITLPNIKAIAPDFNSITHPVWAIEAQYFAGDRVTYQEKNYRALRNNLGQTPDTSPDDWEEFTTFSEWLEYKTKASIKKLIRTFWAKNLATDFGRSILDKKTLFDGAGRINNVLEGEDLVGFEIVPLRAEGVSLKINRIGGQFQGVEDLTIYLFHSSQLEPVKQITLTRTKESSMEWFAQEDLRLDFSGADFDSGGSWYIVYDQAALAISKAINKDRDWSKAPCGSCSNSDYYSYSVWSKFFEVHPFRLSGFDNESPQMWDIQNNVYTLNRNYGLNLDITIECDVTNVLASHKHLFVNAIGLQVAKDMLEEFLNNPSFRINRHQLNPSFTNDLHFALYGDKNSYNRGIAKELEAAINGIQVDTSKLSKVCFSCSKRKGLKIKKI